MSWRRCTGAISSSGANEKRAYLFGSELALYSGRDAGSEVDLRGHTFNGALIDEVVGVTTEFLEQAIQRCSAEPGKLIMLTNPDGPHHPVKVNWVDRAATDSNIESRVFTLADNPGLPDWYEDDLHATQTGAMLRRMAYGEWAVASGSVYGNPARTTRRRPRRSV